MSGGLKFNAKGELPLSPSPSLEGDFSSAFSKVMRTPSKTPQPCRAQPLPAARALVVSPARADNNPLRAMGQTNGLDVLGVTAETTLPRQARNPRLCCPTMLWGLVSGLLDAAGTFSASVHIWHGIRFRAGWSGGDAAFCHPRIEMGAGGDVQNQSRGVVGWPGNPTCVRGLGPLVF